MIEKIEALNKMVKNLPAFWRRGRQKACDLEKTEALRFWRRSGETEPLRFEEEEGVEKTVSLKRLIF